MKFSLFGKAQFQIIRYLSFSIFKNINLFSEQLEERCEEGFAFDFESEKHEGRDGIPAKADQLHGQTQHAHRKAAHVGIQTKSVKFIYLMKGYLNYTVKS